MKNSHQFWFENRSGGKRSTKKTYVELLCTTTCNHRKGEKIFSLT